MTSKCLIGLAALAIMGRGAFAESLVVTPPGFESVEGNSSAINGQPPPTGGRTQQVYPASFFSDLAAGQNTIVAMAWRPDYTITSPQSNSFDVEIWLSTTSVEPGNISTTFASNRGADHTLVYSGPITFETAGAGPPEGPRPFDFVFEFQTPFVYDPSQGNLLREYVYKRGTFDGSPPTIDVQVGFGSTTTVIAFEDTASMATLSTDGNTVTQFTFVPMAQGNLQAGDADQDLKFDQLDLVKVQIAAKYLTGAAATWGEGDWDGAPGGSVGNPPPGDGHFDQLDIIAALNANTYLTGPYAALAGKGTQGDEQTSIIYNPATGEVAVDAPASTELTSINIDSAAAIFTGDAAMNLGGSFDNDADNNIFKATFGSSFGSLSFGNVARAGLSEETVLNDLTVIGSLAGGGDLENVDLVYVPEPATMLLLSVGLAIGLVHFRRISPRNSQRWQSPLSLRGVTYGQWTWSFCPRESEKDFC